MSNTTMMMGLGSAGGGVNVADVFSTTLYTGTSAEQTITNGIDLAGEGGLVWTKGRNNSNYHYLIDTERGAGKFLFSNDTSAQAENTASISSFNSNGYVLGNMNGLNGSPDTFVSWTWRKAPQFFDVVTYTGDGTAGLTVDHNLGSVPGCIIVKSTDDTRDWAVYHRGVDATAPEDYAMVLQKTVAREDNVAWWNDTAPTSTQFTVGNKLDINRSGYNYVAYLFAHNEDLIQCGSYTGNGSTTGPEIDLGWQPQWVMIKSAGSAENWVMYDTVRGIADGGNDAELYANLDANEYNTTNRLDVSATGFQLKSTGGSTNTNNTTYIYMAIKAED